MLQELTNKFERILKDIRGHGKLTEKNIRESTKEIRRALLEADVNYKVVKKFIAIVEEKALGREVIGSVSPGQMLVKIVHDELVSLIGGTHEPIQLKGNPSVIMLVGLQGAGKTTLAGKLALQLQKEGKSVMLAGVDIYRPAAKEQLRIVAEQVKSGFFTLEENNAEKIVREAVNQAKSVFDVLILDTAGRLHIDEELMAELQEIKKIAEPSEILFVADGMTGQDAVNTAGAFQKDLDFTGVVLTKMDGDSRGGAALSIRAVTGIPIKYISVGEKMDSLEAFHPDRMASRILGMGDIVSLVEKAQETISEEDAKKLQKKLRKQQFNFEDFFQQLQMIKKMGPLDQLLGMIPGMGKHLGGMDISDDMFVGVEAIINSMTLEERRNPKIINGSRRKRISLGSGRSVQEINRLLKQFFEMQKMMKQMNKSGRKAGRLKPGRMPFGMKLN
jgi:signal recognition particle subunit SRP54